MGHNAVAVASPQLPHSKVLAVGSFLSSSIHKAGDSVEEKIATSYSKKIASTERCVEPKEMGTTTMQAAKVAYKASHGFSKVAGGAAKVMDSVAEQVVGKAVKKGPENVVGRCAMAYADVQESLSDRASSAVSKAAHCHLEYQEHKDGPEAAQLAYYVGGTAKNVVTGYMDAQKVMQPAKGVAKGLVKKAVVNQVLGRR